MNLYSVLLLCIGSLFYLPSYGQLFTHKHERFGGPLPKAILVQLKSEQRKIHYFEDLHKYEEAEQVKTDALATISAIRNDFNDHFSICPVYYFMDTSLTQIKQHQLNGILYKGDGTLVPDNTITPRDFYMIAYFGPPAGNYPESGDINRVGATGINLFNKNYGVLRDEKALRFTYINPHQNLKNKANKSPYAYESQKYDIYHYPAAAKLEKALKQYYNIKDSN